VDDNIHIELEWRKDNHQDSDHKLINSDMVVRMKTLSEMGDIYFLSDAHLGWGDKRKEKIKERQLLSFLENLQGKAEVLYIVGDFFDFWFEYSSVVTRRNPKILCELYQLIKSGTRVVYLAGNHDFWISSFLSEGIGIEVSQHPMVAIHQGLRIYVTHGDELLKLGPGEKLLRKVLHSPLCIELFSLIHPDLGAVIARWASRPGVRDSKRFDIGYLKRICQRAAQRKFAKGFDAVVMGHIHIPLLQSRSDQTFVILGDWIKHFTYLVLHNGEFELKRWGT
jgi:UDP-2,3-diacylglucosamine hydrolase